MSDHSPPVSSEQTDQFPRVRINSKFARSVFPEDLTQLLFVFGIVCLCVAPQLRWEVPQSNGANVPLLSKQAVPTLIPYAIRFAAAAGWFLCFRAGSRFVRELFWWVCVPVIGALIAECGVYYYFVSRASFPQSEGLSVWYLASLPITLMKRDLGFACTLCGLTSIAVFGLCARLGPASLPLALPKTSICLFDDDSSWRRLHLVLWLGLSGVWKLFTWLPGIAIFALLMRLPKFARQDWVFYALLYSIGFLVVTGLMAWVSRKKPLALLRSSLQLPLPETFVMAPLLPLGAVFLGSLAYYLLSVHGCASWSPRGQQFAHIFSLPSAALLGACFFPALLEELIFRGFLQWRFVARFGALRGIFLTSAVFAACHYGDDFSPLFSGQDVIAHLSIRSLGLMSTSMVFGWLTLRTHSILPAAVAHTIYNALFHSSQVGWRHEQAALVAISMAGLACLLFCRLPIEAKLRRGSAKAT